MDVTSQVSSSASGEVDEAVDEPGAGMNPGNFWGNIVGLSCQEGESDRGIISSNSCPVMKSSS